MAGEDHIDDTRRLGRRMGLVATVLFLGLGWMFFQDVLDKRNNPNQELAVSPGSSRELVLQRNRSGHYVAPGTLNGQPVTFLLDTGATVVSVPAGLGSELGLSAGAHSVVSTANGDVSVRETRIAELGMGPFVLRDVRAQLNPGMEDDQVLLGMNVLKRLEFIQRGDTLTLRAPQH